MSQEDLKIKKKSNGIKRISCRRKMLAQEKIYGKFSFYSEPTLILFGTFGALLNQIVFQRRKLFRSSSCSFYFRVSSINDLFVLYLIVFPQWLDENFQINPLKENRWFCKIRSHLTFSLYAISPYCIVLACFDRFCRTSPKTQLRRLATLPIARRFMFLSISTIFIVYFHVPLHYSIVDSKCIPFNSSYSRFFAYFLSIFYSFLPPCLMSIFCAYTYRSLNDRLKIFQKTASKTKRRRATERCLMKLFFLYVLTNLICVLPFTIVFLNNIDKSRSDPQISLFNKLSMLLVHMNYCTSFYFYTLSTPSYRRELFQFIRYGHGQPTARSIVLGQRV